MSLYWADLHNHNSVGVGKGDLLRSYSIAGSSLDAYAFTPHGWWPDVPDNDSRIRDYHLAGFAKVKKSWDKIVQTANEWNEKDRFAALVAYEWHSSRWGDYCVYFPGETGTLFCAGDLTDLQTFVRSQGAIMLPHHCAYAKGWRGTDWDGWASDVSPTAEIFSEHGNSLEPDSHFGMYRHSTGGSDFSQSVIHHIRAGKTLGFTAGTDDHYGHPGCYGEGLTGIYADSLTRESIFDALRKRHTFAVTGDRIELDLTLGQGIMGDILPLETPRELAMSVRAQNEIDYVELFKNGWSVCKWHDFLEHQAPDILRLEWGWGGMTSDLKTEWKIGVSLEPDLLLTVFPCFCGGPDVLEDENYLRRLGDGVAEIRSNTSRTNFLPTHAAVMGIAAGADAEVTIDLQGMWGDSAFARSTTVKLNELRSGDRTIQMTPVFSSPRFKIHRLCPGGKRVFDGEWTDSDPGEDDSYFIKVLQKNGHMAWSSPIWCRKAR